MASPLAAPVVWRGALQSHEAPRLHHGTGTHRRRTGCAHRHCSGASTVKKRKRVAKELSRLQTQLETAERREHWDTVLMLDREIDRIGLDVACTNGVHN